MTRERLSNSIAIVAIAIALVPPLCVSGIGLTMGSDVIAIFGRGTLAGLSNQITKGSSLLFLANLIDITFASLIVFLLQQCGSLGRCWRNLLIWLGFLGLLCIPLSFSLHDFSVRQHMDAEIRRFKSGRAQHFGVVKANPFLWSHILFPCSNVRIVDNQATLDLVLNAPEKMLTRAVLDDVFKHLKSRAVDFGLKDNDVNISVIPNRVFRYQAEAL